VLITTSGFRFQLTVSLMRIRGAKTRATVAPPTAQTRKTDGVTGSPGRLHYILQSIVQKILTVEKSHHHLQEQQSDNE